ncbi:hypothetical protein OH77DRAFT_344620 [Trametes cingulata]|nr:hypothetical protein OH77DRAFT_344620 [Trametes cingulata]
MENDNYRGKGVARRESKETPGERRTTRDGSRTGGIVALVSQPARTLAPDHHSPPPPPAARRGKLKQDSPGPETETVWVASDAGQVRLGGVDEAGRGETEDPVRDAA